MFARFRARQLLIAGVSSLLVVFADTAVADTAAARKVGFVPSGPSSPALLAPTSVGRSTGDVTQYVFSAPPRESTEVAAEIYTPLANYLTRVTGKQVVFRRSPNWIAYQTEMRRGDFDLIFDGPHFNSWRASNLQHNILVKAPGEHSFVVVVKANSRIHDLKQLTGRAVCGMSPPNLGTLAVLGSFDNPVRQPVIRNTIGWNKIYTDMIAGHCAAAILPTRNFAKYDPAASTARVIHKVRGFPSQALSAGPRVSAADQAAIIRALTSPDSRAATLRLRDAYALNGDLQPTSKDEYAGAARILKDTWGYQ